jgi:hypothetical protein
LGALPFFLYPRAGDLISDATYYELARSLADDGWYGYNSRTETMLPPGFPAVIALLRFCFGDGYAVFIRSMAVFATLALLATYALFRREVGRGPAAAICLLVGSSPVLFDFSTRLLFSDLPYLFTSTLALLAARQLDGAATRRARAALWLSVAGLLACSLLLRSAAVTLLGALAAWLAFSAAVRYVDLRARLRAFLPLLALAVAIQGAWMAWAAAHEKLVWPLGGYPGSYTSQIELKAGNHPELGKASLADIPARVEENVVAHSAGLLRVVLRRLSPLWCDYTWYSPLIVGTVMLILLGLSRSPWVTGSGLLQWYFVCHEAMYLLWPWDLEIRFLLPAVPLACVYLWRGGCALADLLRREPRKTAAALLALSALMGLYPAYLVISGQGGKKALVIWAAVAVCSAAVAGLRGPRAYLASALSRPRVLGAAAAAVVATLVGIGVAMDVRSGLDNLNFDVKQADHYPDIEAGQWVASHTASDAVVLARKEDLVYHFSSRKVIWFPPSSDPKLLMDGIAKYHVDWVVVVEREDSYFLPADDACFARLEETYPGAFRLVHRGPNNRIYQVTPPRDCLVTRARTRE